ncbi:hypothetical protein RKD19_001085 [Streptomyces canus]
MAEPDEAETVLGEGRADGGQVGGDGTDALHQGVGGLRAQLQLAAGFDGERRRQGHGPQCGVGRRESFGRDGEPRVAQLVDEPFHFHPDAAGRAGLEADAADQGLELCFGERCTRLRTVAE